MPSSNYFRGKVIDSSLRAQTFPVIGTVYVALHTSDPTVAGISATEIVATWYARQVAAFVTQPSPGVTSNSATITFPAVTTAAVTVTHFSIYDSLSTGNMLYFAPLASSKTFNPSDVPSWLAGSLTVTAA